MHTSSSSSSSIKISSRGSSRRLCLAEAVREAVLHLAFIHSEIGIPAQQRMSMSDLHDMWASLSDALSA